MSAKLYAIQHDVDRKLWCGPAAIAAVTGLPTSEVYEACDRVLGRQTKRMSAHQVARALRALGHEARGVFLDRPKPTFAKFRKIRSPEYRRRPLILLLTGHFVVLAGNRFVDSNNLDPILASDYWRQKKRVIGFVELT